MPMPGVAKCHEINAVIGEDDISIERRFTNEMCNVGSAFLALVLFGMMKLTEHTKFPRNACYLGSAHSHRNFGFGDDATAFWGGG